MVTTTPEETSELIDLAKPLILEGLQQGGDQLLTVVRRLMEALEDIAALPCASDLPLCHNPGCASCRARRALAFPEPGGEWVDLVCPRS
jgi:hypothetical protein